MRRRSDSLQRALLDHYQEKKESSFGIMKASVAPAPTTPAIITMNPTSHLQNDRVQSTFWRRRSFSEPLTI